MEVPIDKRRLSDTQRAELFENGAIRIIDEQTHQEITIDLQAGARLYAFMHFHDHLGDLYADVENE